MDTYPKHSRYVERTTTYGIFWYAAMRAYLMPRELKWSTVKVKKSIAYKLFWSWDPAAIHLVKNWWCSRLKKIDLVPILTFVLFL